MEPLGLGAVALALLAFGLVSRRAERSPLTPPMCFVTLGLVLGAGGLDWLDINPEGDALHTLAEITLVLVLFSDASRIDLSCLRRERNLPARLLGIGLPLTILTGAIAAMAIWPGVLPLEALLLAAILAPTDAALGQAVVSNRLVPVRIRQSLNVESGLNDGVALPLVLILASLAGAREQTGDAAYWARFALLAVTLGPLAGWAVGYVGGRLLERATRTGWINGVFERLSALGVALLAYAGAELIGGNGFIAAFVAGLTLGNTARRTCECLYEFAEAEGQLLTLLVFVALGAALVPAALHAVDGRTVVYALVSLTVVRLLPVALSLAGTGLHPASVGFLGWFGPRGLASILFALLVVKEGSLDAADTISSVVVVTVLMSTFLHGATAYPLAKLYGAFAATRHESHPEHGDAPDLPVRIRHAD